MTSQTLECTPVCTTTIGEFLAAVKVQPDWRADGRIPLEMDF